MDKMSHAVFLGIGFLSVAIIERKRLGVLGNKFFNPSLGKPIFKKGHPISGPISAGILGGTATALSYRYSPYIAKQTNSEDDLILILTRAGVTAGTTLVITMLFIRQLATKLSPHQISYLNTFSYTAIATAVSLCALYILDDLFEDILPMVCIVMITPLAPIYLRKGYDIVAGNWGNPPPDWERIEGVKTPSLAQTAKMGLYAGAVTGVVAAIAYLVVKTLASFGNTFPAIKGTVPAALVLGTSYFGARHVLDLTEERHGIKTEPLKILLSSGAAVVAGTVLIPKVSSFMLKKRVGYLSATGLSLLAAIPAAAPAIFNQYGDNIEDFIKKFFLEEAAI